MPPPRFVRMSTFSSSLTVKEEEEIKEFFMLCDKDENGALDVSELQKMFAKFNVIVRQEDIKTFLEHIDSDEDGLIDFDELMTYIEEILSEHYTNDDVINAFSMIDIDGSGDVTLDEVAQAMQTADVGVSHEDVVYLLEEADLNSDGKISFSEFRNLFLGSTSQ